MSPTIRPTVVRLALTTLLPAVIALVTSPTAAQVPGGFVESTTAGVTRPTLTGAELGAFLPAGRGGFTFPPPYGTRGVRLTVDGDCGGQDCVNPVGYSYWRNINNHVGSDTMLIVLGLARERGGGGPTLLSYNKVTDQATSVGPLFDPASPFSWASGEGWYFSATLPTTLYINLPVTPGLLRYDVSTRTFTTVFDVSTRPDLFGTNRYIWQFHSSSDDRVHSATLRDAATFAELGCLAYREDTNQFFYFPQKGFLYDECQVDRSGRWLLIKEKLGVDAGSEVDNRIIDLTTGVETDLLDRNGAGGHSDNGHGYMVASDNWNVLPGAIRMWKLGDPASAGALVYHDVMWGTAGPQHVSHTNAIPGTPESQYVCGSGASAVNGPRANEVLCFPLDGSLRVLVVAPVMTDMKAAGGGDPYGKLPKGNLDVTGQYFIWTSNLGGNRADAFLVKVPATLIAAGAPSPPVPPPPAPSPVATVTRAGSGSGSVSSTPAGISCGTDCAEPYPTGTTITLTAAPATGSLFVSWGGACTGQPNPCVLTMSADLSATATFAPAVTLTATRTGDTTSTVVSSPTGITCGTDCSEKYAKGTVVTLTAKPAPGSVFRDWSGACGGQAPTCTVTMSASKSVTARFRRR